MNLLPNQGWTLLKDSWFVEWNNTEKLQKIYSKRVDAGKTISFTSSKNDMTFAIFISAIFMSQGTYFSFLDDETMQCKVEFQLSERGATP